MADIFHEVDEEVRREQLKKLWERYSIYLIAAAVLLVAGIGAWRGYEYWVAKKAAAAGAAFEAALTLSSDAKYAEAEAAFAKLAADAPSGYRLLSRMRAAAALSQVKPAEAIKAFDELSARSVSRHNLARHCRLARRDVDAGYRIACGYAQAARSAYRAFAQLPPHRA